MNMSETYNYDACDACSLAICVFDNDSLTIKQQDARCPAVITNLVVDTRESNYNTWRAEKLEIIRAAIQERGPIPLAELPTLTGVSLPLIRSWRLYFMEAERVELPRQRGSLAYVTSVSLSLIQRDTGHEIATREWRLQVLRQTLEKRGPLRAIELSHLLNIPISTLHYWIGRYVRGGKRRIDHPDGKNKEVMFISSVM